MNEAKGQETAITIKEINCKDCGNWLCGANGSDQTVLCFLGYEKGEQQHV